MIPVFFVYFFLYFGQKETYPTISNNEEMSLFILGKTAVKFSSTKIR